MSTPALTITGLEVSYDSTPVLRGVDLTVEPDGITAVVGASGCGKTTLLRAIAGFVAPDAGTIELHGERVSDARRQVPAERRGVALVPQEGALFPHLDVAANVAFGLQRVARAGRSTRVSEVLDLVGLGGFEKRRPHELSGGQQQRVALARALAPEPRLVLLDEPFSALDAGLREAIRADVRQALHHAGATAILVTHDQDEALSTADSVAVLDAGRVAMHGSPQEVYAAPADLSVARFVGQLVELPATVTGGIARTALGPILIPATPDGAGVVVLRPEQITVLDGAAREGVAGRVEDTAYFGHDATVTVRVAGQGESAEQLVVARTLGHLPATSDVRLKVNGTARFFAASGPR